jgi:hypothetical protein
MTPRSLTAAINGTSPTRTLKMNKLEATQTKSPSTSSLDGCNTNNIWKWSRNQNPVNQDPFSTASKTQQSSCQSCKKLTNCLPCAIFSTSKAHIYWELTKLISTVSYLKTAKILKKHSLLFLRCLGFTSLLDSQLTVPRVTKSSDSNLEWSLRWH